MPAYDYRCEKCKRRFSVSMTIMQHEKKRTGCPRCGSRRVNQQLVSFFAVTSKKS